MSTTVTPNPLAPQGNVVAIGVTSQDYPRLVFTAPYFEQVALAELIEPSVIEAVESALPALVPPYVQGAANDAVQQLAVLLTGSAMSGPLYLNPVIPTQPSQAASMAYVDAMIATAGIPEVPPVPAGQTWARQTGQWVPISEQEGVFLPLAGGTMQGQINMSGNTITNMAALPVMPNGAAPAQWVLNQIAAQSLYQGTWVPDTNTPDLTLPGTHQNGFTWIVTTSTVGGVVVGAAIPGLQGQTVFNGDTVIYSAIAGQFQIIHGGGLSLEEAQALFLPLAGGQMSGALLLNANASQPMQAVTYQQLQAFVPPGAVTEAPNTGQLYGRNGLTTSWAPVLPLAGGVLTGALTLFNNATQPLQAVPFQQLTSAISGAVAAYLPLAGGAMSGLMTLSGNAASALNPVPLQQVSGMLAGYLPLSGGTLTGNLNGTTAAFSGQVNFATGSQPNFYAGTVSGDATLSFASGHTISLQPGGITIFTAANIALVPGQSSFVTIGASGLFALSDNGAERSIIYAGGGYADSWEIANGTREWLSGPYGTILTMDALGNLGIVGTASKPGGGAWTDSSDARIKNVRGSYTKSLAAIMQLQPKQFAYLGNDTTKPPDSGQTAPYPGSAHASMAKSGAVYNGLIADEVMAVFPECVTETSGYINGAAVSDLKLLDTTVLLYALINAVNELGQRMQAVDGKAAT